MPIEKPAGIVLPLPGAAQEPVKQERRCGRLPNSVAMLWRHRAAKAVQAERIERTRVLIGQLRAHIEEATRQIELFSGALQQACAQLETLEGGNTKAL